MKDVTTTAKLKFQKKTVVKFDQQATIKKDLPTLDTSIITITWF